MQFENKKLLNKEQIELLWMSGSLFLDLPNWQNTKCNTNFLTEATSSPSLTSRKPIKTSANANKGKQHQAGYTNSTVLKFVAPACH